MVLRKIVIKRLKEHTNNVHKMNINYKFTNISYKSIYPLSVLMNGLS